MRGSRVKPRLSSLILFASALVITAGAARAAQSHESSTAPASNDAAGLYVEVRLNQPMKAKTLKPGDVVEGTLARDVYARDHELFPAGSKIRLTVDHLEKRKRERNDHWPGLIVLFSPRHVDYPDFRSATVSRPGGDVPLSVSLISITHPVKVRAGKPKGSGEPAALAASAQPEAGPEKDKKRKASETLILEGSAAQSLGAMPFDSIPAAPVDLPAGTMARIVLLAPLSASKSRPGDLFHARLIEPVRSGSSIIIPAGSFFDGKVVRSKPPRWLSRPGSLYLAFTELTLPGGNRVPVAAQLTGAEADQRSHLRLDAEGGLSGGRPGKAWMLINLGVAAGISKEADDGFQLIAEALVSTATDASTAGTARIVAACASGIYMVTRHGRDVVLPRFTELDVTFSRPLSVAQDSPGEGSQPAKEAVLEAGLHSH